MIWADYFSLSLSIYIYMYMCVCVYIYTYTHIYIYWGYYCMQILGVGEIFFISIRLSTNPRLHFQG